MPKGGIYAPGAHCALHRLRTVQGFGPDPMVSLIDPQHVVRWNLLECAVTVPEKLGVALSTI